MALHAITAKGVAVGTIAAVVIASLVLLRILASHPDHRPVLPARPLVAGLVSVPDFEPPERGRQMPPAPLDRPPAVEVIGSRTLAASGLTPVPELPPAPARFPLTADPARPLLASRPLVIAIDDTQVGPVQTNAPRAGAITRAMGTTSRAFRVAGTSVASAFRKVF
jgi:hypothetical protein